MKKEKAKYREARTALISKKAEVERMLEAGHMVRSIHEELFGEDSPLKYRQLSYYINKYMKGAKKKKGNKSSMAVADKQYSETVKEKGRKTFKHNASANIDDLI